MGKKIEVKLTNRWLYSLIFISTVLLIAVGVYAFGATPNPGHSWSQIAGCDSANQIPEWDGSSWNCVAMPSGTSTSLWSSSGSNVYYSGGNVGIGTSSPSESLVVNGNISFSGIKTWFQQNGSRTQLCYNGASCAIKGNTCTKTSNINFVLEGTCSTDANNLYCASLCMGTIACSTTYVSGCTGANSAYYTGGSLVSCSDTTHSVTCSCSINGATYYSEYLQNPTCLG